MRQLEFVPESYKTNLLVYCHSLVVNLSHIVI